MNQNMFDEPCRVCGARLGGDSRSFVFEKGRKPICFFCSALEKVKSAKKDEYLTLLKFAYWHYEKHGDGTLIAEVEDYSKENL